MRRNEEVKRITMHQHSSLFSMQTGVHGADARTDGGPKVTLPLRVASVFFFLSIPDYLLNSSSCFLVFFSFSPFYFFMQQVIRRAPKSSAASHLPGRESARPQHFLAKKNKK